MSGIAKAKESMTLRQKIIIFGALMIILPTMVVWIASSLLFYIEQDRNAREMMSNTLRQTMLNIDSQIDVARISCNTIAFDPTFLRYLYFARIENLSDAEILDGLFYLNKLISNYESINTSTEISIYLDSPELLVSNNRRYISLSETPDYIMKLLEERNTASLVLAPTDYAGRDYPSIQKRYYTVVQSASGKTTKQGLWALVVARIDATSIHNIIDGITVDSKSFVCLNDDAEVFFSRGGGQDVPWPEGLPLPGPEVNQIDIQGERYNVFHARSDKTGWRLMAVIDMDSYMWAARRMAVIAFATGIVFSAAAGVVAVRYFAGIARHLERLQSHMGLAAQGDYDTPIALGGDAEIQALQSSYNTMITIIRTLIEDKYRQQLQLQYHELKGIENQIKPHFLYNTLDALKFKAIRAGADEVASNLEDMARYFRTVLAGGRLMLTMLDEAEHCRLYVRLQNFRYGEGIELDIRISSEVAFCSLLRFLLQPLVENAIVHGIRPKPDRSGKIVLSAFRREKALIIQVTDDGVGMPESVSKKLPGTQRDGFGVWNVHSRIQVFYGSEYGLSFPKTDGEGTCAEVRIPYELDQSYAEAAADIDPADVPPTEAL